jgi:hypothetical protein
MLLEELSGSDQKIKMRMRISRIRPPMLMYMAHLLGLTGWLVTV